MEGNLETYFLRDEFNQHVESGGYNSCLIKEDFLKKVCLVHNSSKGDFKFKKRTRMLLDSLGMMENPSEILDSLDYNLRFDFNNFQVNLPENFDLIRSTNGVHIENANQFAICYENIKNNEERYGVLTLNFYFEKQDGDIRLKLNNLQGWFSSSRGTQRKYMKNAQNYLKKLSDFYGINWRAGLVKEIKTFANIEKIDSFGEMPPPFYCFGDTDLNEYLRYSLCYLESFLNGGISLEKIDFKRIHPNFKKGFEELREGLMRKSRKEQCSLVGKLRKNHSKFYKKEFREYIGKDKISLQEYESRAVKGLVIDSEFFN